MARKRAKTVKKPSPAYLAELEKLKRTKRKKAVGNTYQIPYSNEDDEVGDEYWEVYILSSYDEIDMRTFEEEEEYFNNISKVKQELKDHPDRYERDIVWTFKLSQKKGGVLSSGPPLRFIYRNGFWGYNDGDVDIEGDVPDELGVERLQDFLCEKFQIGEESMSGGDSGEEGMSGGESGIEEEEEEEEEEEKEEENAWIIRAFKERAKEETNPHKRKAWENATTALDNISLTIHSVEDVKNVKGVGKSSCAFLEELFKNRDEAPNEKEKAAKEFFNTAVNGRELDDNNNDFRHDVVDIKEALASLPEDAEIGLDESGTLYVNGCRREYFHAKGCPFKTEVDGVKYIVDGTGDYDAFSDACAGLEFSGTLTNVKNKKVFNFSFSYKHNGGNGAEEYEELEWNEAYFEEDAIEGIAMEVVGNYEFAFCE